MSGQFLTSVFVITVVLHLMLLACAYLILLERKVSAWAQDRIGPNRVGFGMLVRPVVNIIVYLAASPLLLFGIRVDPDRMWQQGAMRRFWETQRHFGLGQALIDGIKLILKEDYNPPHVERALFFLAPALAVVPAMIAWAVIPWGGLMQFPAMTIPAWIPLWGGAEIAEQVVTVAVAPINIGVIYILAMGSLAVYGIVVGGYASNNKYSFLGGLRATAQMLSYEIPLGLCVLIVILTFQTSDAALMSTLQTGNAGDGAWGLFLHPLLAVIFFITILAENNRAPFDLAEAEQELVGGFHTEYTSMKWALFFLGEYMHMITGSAFFCVLFLGGWDLIPFVQELPVVGGIGVVALKMSIFFLKVAFLLFVMMWVRWTLPRLRFDQLMKLAWRGLIPITLVMLLVTAMLVYLDPPALGLWLCIANIVVAAGAAVLGPKLPQGPAVNRRVRLEGSRFYAPEPEPREPAGQA